jgi:Flp pilus assembly pilin Flp
VHDSRFLGWNSSDFRATVIALYRHGEMMFANRSLRDDRGAASIEYALIGALIAVGIIGSLVGTKSSLSDIFGVAATQMSSSGATGSSAGLRTSNSLRAPYWQAKMLSGSPVTTVNGAVKSTVYGFTDGTTATFSTGNANQSANRISIFDPTANVITYFWSDSAGNPSLFQQSIMNSYSQVVRANFASYTNGDTFTATSPNVERVYLYSYSSNSPTASPTGSSGSTQAPQAAYQAAYVDGRNDLQYFSDITP